MARKKTPKSGVLNTFYFDQPFIGFSTKFRSVPTKGKGAPLTHAINYGGSCREELVWDTREFLQGRTVSWKTEKGSWRKNAILARTIDVEHRALKQPGITYLWVNEDEAEDYGPSKGICRRPCCVGRFPELIDAVVGPIAVLLNNDRYQGDWWKTSPEETAPKDKKELRWYGTDNFFLRHPVLTSLMMGVFRQGVLLFEQGFDDAILRAVNRKDVEDCLTNADPVLAMQLMNTLRPWLEVTRKQIASSFAFPKGHWGRLRQLHRAIYKHGYDALFDANMQQSWNIADCPRPTDQFGASHDRYAISTGPMAYWGTAGKKVTEAGKRLAKLGK